MEPCFVSHCISVATRAVHPHLWSGKTAWWTNTTKVPTSPAPSSGVALSPHASPNKRAARWPWKVFPMWLGLLILNRLLIFSITWPEILWLPGKGRLLAVLCTTGPQVRGLSWQGQVQACWAQRPCQRTPAGPRAQARFRNSTVKGQMVSSLAFVGLKLSTTIQPHH